MPAISRGDHVLRKNSALDLCYRVLAVNKGYVHLQALSFPLTTFERPSNLIRLKGAQRNLSEKKNIKKRRIYFFSTE